MSDYFEKLQELVGHLGDEEEREQYLFNPLEEFHANENAHTRVLVALLKIPFVCRSFLQYLHKKFPSANEWFNGCDAEPTKVSCFSDYVDAAITVGRKTAIIENKINGAEDQDSQIDRYVTAKASASRSEDILVFYLTLDGSKEVSACSFDKSKNILKYQGPESPGRFLAINYRDHILDWLQNYLRFSVHSLLDQPILYCGVVQYIDYLKGDRCLSIRETNDKCTNDILKNLRKDDLDSAVCVMSEYAIRKARFRARLIETASTESDWNRIPEYEKAWVLKTVFCQSLGIACPDDDFFANRPNRDENKFPLATITIGKWVDTSPVQIDFWFDGTGDVSTYKQLYDNFRKKLEESDSGYPLEYEYNDTLAVRCPIQTQANVRSILEVIGIDPDLPRNNTVDGGFPENDSVENWLRLESHLVMSVRKFAQEIGSDQWPKWQILEVEESRKVDYTYHWVNGWAIQLSENFSSEMPIRAIEFFPARETDVSPVVHELAAKRSKYPFRNYRWDGRTVFQFPVNTKEYAKQVCSFLDELRNTLTV